VGRNDNFHTEVSRHGCNTEAHGASRLDSSRCLPVPAKGGLSLKSRQFIVNRDQLFAGGEGKGIKAGAATPGEDDAFHEIIAEAQIGNSLVQKGLQNARRRGYPQP
jgi:hypothetical protein